MKRLFLIPFLLFAQLVTGQTTLLSGSSIPLSIANGGTGQITANNALNALLPSQTGANGKTLQSDGTNTSWVTAGAASVSIGSSVTSGTAGSVLFLNGSTQLAQDNTNFVWDYTNNRLGLGDNTPSALLSVGSSSQFQVDGSGNVDAGGTIALSGDISPSQITGNQDDYNPTSLNTASVLRINSDASRNITGLQGGVDGRIIIIHNVGTNDINLKNNVTSTTTNRFLIGADLTLKGDQSATFYYDGTTQRWRLLAQGQATYASYQATPSDPTGTTSATVVMMGLAGAITPTATGRVMVIMSGDAGGTTLTAGTKEVRYGTGSAPTNGAATTGTAATPTRTFNNANTSRGEWSLQGIVSGLTVGTAYWFDLGISRSSGTIAPKNISISIMEF